MVARGEVVNFTATTNIPARQVTVVAGTDVSTVSLDGSTTVLTKTFAEGDSVSIAATCNGDNKFAGWGLSPEFGAFADRNSASTTFTVGANDVTITAHCGQYVMQNMTTTMCPTTPVVAIDSRDGHEYTVAKLADGNCWMTDNLRLGLNTSNPNTTAFTLTPSDSDVSQNRSFTAYDLVEYGQSGEECYGIYNSTTPTDSTGLGYSTPCVHSGANSGTNGNNTVWYNYAAASAGTIVTPGSSTDAIEATESICPKGWKLPSKTQIQDLVTAIGSSPSTFSPISGGYYGHNGVIYYENTSYWWSSMKDVAHGKELWANLHYDTNSDLISYSRNVRYFGLYVRCVLR